MSNPYSTSGNKDLISMAKKKDESILNAGKLKSIIFISLGKAKTFKLQLRFNFLHQYPLRFTLQRQGMTTQPRTHPTQGCNNTFIRPYAYDRPMGLFFILFY